MARSGFDQRSAMVLKAVVENYMATIEPVGARAISRMSGFNLSPATIRNVMSNLEEEGYLSQPHTSAGRIPSDMGYRFYAETVAGPSELPLSEMELIRCATHGAKWQEIADLIGSVSKTMAELSSQAGIVGITTLSQAPVREIKFVYIAENRSLAVMITAGGEIRTRLINSADSYTQDELDRIANYLNARFAGMTLEGIRQSLIHEMTAEKETVDTLARQALMMAELVEEQVSAEDNIHLEGASNLFNRPGAAADISNMKALFKTFDEKSRLVSLITDCLKSEGINLIIGSEFELDGFSDYSMVTHRFKGNDGAMGAVGIIGPKAMNYGHAMGLVLYAARQIGMRLNG